MLVNFFCEQCKIGVQFHLFFANPVFSTPFIKETVISPLDILSSLVKYSLTLCEDLFLGS